MLNDIEIAQKAEIKPINEIAKKLEIDEDSLELYGKYKAKINLNKEDLGSKRGKLIYVTAITPTPAGEGKTCTAIGITQALGRLDKNVALCLREPSLGPTFGIKGGAAGGGYSQVIPMEDINLHFTGDIHAIGAAHNLLAALVDNHIVKGNRLGLDPVKVVWKRVMDISDRQLRNIVVGLGGKVNGIPRETGFDITVASEIMAILCLAKDMKDLKQRLSEIIVGYTYEGDPVLARDLKAVGAMALLLKDAIKPNVVQTLEGQPVFIHGGPFANIAHGNNSVVATKTALQLSDYVVTEGGFGSDLGAEKFFDIVCRDKELIPDTVVLVATIRALKYHGGVSLKDIKLEDVNALKKGLANLEKHVFNIKERYRLPVVVAINKFPQDTDCEIETIKNFCESIGARVAISEVVSKGGLGGIELSEQIMDSIEKDENNFVPLYDLDLDIQDKIQKVATQIYGAQGVSYSRKALRELDNLGKMGYGNLPVCIAKTQMSLSDDPSLLGAPKDWTMNVREIKISAGAGFIVVLAGTMLTMPGLPKHPAAESIDILDDGTIIGLF
ncbi:MAG: formate--tetrahydrofolate ligase [Clostridia bacterium]|nr:formate--tetrahydrofolate ligase [Clostridia bacterium]